MPTPIRSRLLTEDIEISTQRKKMWPRGRQIDIRGETAREPPPVNFGQAILVMSGQSRMMYQNLKPKPEGTIFSKRSNASGVGQSSSRRSHHYDMVAESIIRGVRTESGPVLTPFLFRAGISACDE